MFSKYALKIDPILYDRAKRFASDRGYSSVKEFLMHILERELASASPVDTDKEKIAEKMKGLGYF